MTKTLLQITIGSVSIISGGIVLSLILSATSFLT